MKRSADPNSDNMRAEFRQKLEHYQAAPSPNLWDKIDLSLDKEEALVYKNRFRTYSRLAAACLLLLLAFSAVFIPNKLKQIKDGNSGIAAVPTLETYNKNAGSQLQETTENAITKSAKTQENATVSGEKTAHSSAEMAQQKPVNPTSEIAFSQPEKTAENAIISGQKTAKNGTVSSGKTTQNAIVSDGKTDEFSFGENSENFNKQTARIAASAKKKTEPENAIAFENASPEKTVAFNAPKVNQRSSQPAPIETPENAMVQAAKTAHATKQNSENHNPDEIQHSTSETNLATISSTQINAPELAFNTETTNSESKTAAISEKQKTGNSVTTFSKKAVSNKIEEPAINRTFSNQTHSILAEKSTSSALPLLETQTSEIQKTEPATFVLPDSNMLATLPEAPESTELNTVSAEKSSGKTRKWQVAAAFSGRGFKTGMQLASQAKLRPSIGSNATYQEQQLQEYKAAIQEFNENTKSSFSEGGALKLGFKLSENWMLQSGFTYLKHRAQTLSQYAFYTGTNSNAPGTGNLHATEQLQPTLLTALENSFVPGQTQILKTEGMQTNYTFQQIGLPLNLRFQTVAPKLYYFGAAGFSINLVKTVTVEHEAEKIILTPVSENTNFRALSGPNPKLFRKWLPAVNLQAGAGYHMSERWQLELAVEGEQYLKPLIQAEEQAGSKQQNPLSIGASLQLGYSF